MRATSCENELASVGRLRAPGRSHRRGERQQVACAALTVAVLLMAPAIASPFQRARGSVTVPPSGVPVEQAEARGLVAVSITGTGGSTGDVIVLRICQEITI